MWLYAAYKFGQACTVLTIFYAVLCVIAIPIFSECGECGKSIAKFIWISSLFVLPITLPIATLMPGKYELNMYANSANSKDVVNSDESKELFDAAIKFLEGETKNKD